MTILQLHVNNNSTMLDLFENEETKHITIKEILECKCDDIFEKNSDKPIQKPGNIIKFSDLSISDPKVELLKMLTSTNQSISFSISELVNQLEEARKIETYSSQADKYFTLFKNLKLKELISYYNLQKEEQLKINIENKQADLELQQFSNSLPSMFEEIKINFTKALINEKELIKFFNNHNITPQMLTDYIESGTIFTRYLLDSDDFPFHVTSEQYEIVETQILIDNFFNFMNYNIIYQILETYTQLSSINFLAIFEFKKLHLGSIGEIASCINSSTSNYDDPDEINITFGGLIEIKKKKVQLEIWEKI